MFWLPLHLSRIMRKPVLCCTIITHISDLEIKVTDFEILHQSFFSTFLLWKQLRQIGGWTSVSLVLWVMKWRSAWPIFHGPLILPYILKTIWCMNITLWDYESVWPDVWPQNKCRSLWPIFHGPVILPYILKTVWCMNILLRNYESVWPDVWPQNKCRSLWPIFHGPVILPYILKTTWCMNIILWDYESVLHNIWPQNKCRSLWPIFNGPVILPYILKTIWYMNTILWDYESVWPDPMFDLKIFVAHCDLYFMVQWFCLISWKLFSGWTSYLRIMSQYDPT